MPRRGENIRKRKDGRWEGRYITSHNTEGKAMYRSVYAKTYSEVRSKIKEEQKKDEQKKDEQKKDDDDNLSVDAVAEKWLQTVKKYKKYSTYIKYNYVYQNHIKPYMGRRKIGTISTDEYMSLIDIESHKSNKEGKQLAKSTINGICIVLSQIMKYGNHQVSLSFNTSRTFDSGHNLGTAAIFTREEQQKMQEYLLEEVNGYKLGIYICMLTGVRLGEICALETNNIDLSKRVISIEQTVQRIRSEKLECKTELMVTEPKTVNSKREIPICDILFSVLNKHMLPDTYLVNGNKIMEPRTYQYYFQKILNELSIEKRSFHSLRHTFATNCIASGMDPKCLSEILGHSDVKITLNRYVHPSLENKIEQINSFASNYGQINGQV